MRVYHKPSSGVTARVAGTCRAMLLLPQTGVAGVLAWWATKFPVHWLCVYPKAQTLFSLSLTHTHLFQLFCLLWHAPPPTPMQQHRRRRRRLDAGYQRQYAKTINGLNERALCCAAMPRAGGGGQGNQGPSSGFKRQAVILDWPRDAETTSKHSQIDAPTLLSPARSTIFQRISRSRVGLRGRSCFVHLGCRAT